jgi:serine/threonine protein kinase
MAASGTRNLFLRQDRYAKDGLVSLYELFFEEGQWFFTMEFVEGIDFLRYVRSGNVTEAQASCPAPSAEPCEFPRPDAAPTPSRPQLGRLRAGLGQLAEGVLAIHQAGKLHRDIKPSNVLVPEDGRVVLLDFGLATELTQPEGEEATAYNLVGTAAYIPSFA